jgi:hypothetical protein
MVCATGTRVCRDLRDFVAAGLLKSLVDTRGVAAGFAVVAATLLLAPEGGVRRSVAHHGQFASAEQGELRHG